MVRITVTIESEEAKRVLEEAPERVTRAVKQWLPAVGQLTRATMIRVTRPKLKHPKGLMLASVRSEVAGGEARVGPNVPYARFVNYPTKPHLIFPRRAKALTIPRAGGVVGTRGSVTRVGAAGPERVPRRITRFAFGGRTATTSVRFARFVRHPGTPGLFFVEETADAVAEPARTLLEEFITRGVRE